MRTFLRPKIQVISRRRDRVKKAGRKANDKKDKDKEKAQKDEKSGIKAGRN